MAPMIDIMFLLLIFFMAAAIYAQWETKIEITVPTAEAGKRGDRQPGEIIINVDAEGRLFVNDVEMEMPRLRSILAQISTEFEDQPVIIRADGKTDHARVMGVLDACRSVDIWNVAFAVIPDRGP